MFRFTNGVHIFINDKAKQSNGVQTERLIMIFINFIICSSSFQFNETH